MLNHDAIPLSFSSRLAMYSHASIVNNTTYISAQTGQHFISEDLSADFFIQFHPTLKNLQSICEASGGSLAYMVKLDIFLKNINTLPIVATIRHQYFADLMPACTVLGVTALLVNNALVAIDAMMVLA